MGKLINDAHAQYPLTTGEIPKDRYTVYLGFVRNGLYNISYKLFLGDILKSHADKIIHDLEYRGENNYGITKDELSKIYQYFTKELNKTQHKFKLAPRTSIQGKFKIKNMTKGR